MAGKGSHLALPRSPGTGGVWTERLEERVAHRAERLRAELRDAVINEPDVDVTEVFDTVYHRHHPGAGAPTRPAGRRIGEGG